MKDGVVIITIDRTAIHRQQILCEIICSNTQEVSVLQKTVEQYNCGWRFDHKANGWTLPQPLLHRALFHDVDCADYVVGVDHHRQQNAHVAIGAVRQMLAERFDGQSLDVGVERSADALAGRRQ